MRKERGSKIRSQVEGLILLVPCKSRLTKEGREGEGGKSIRLDIFYLPKNKFRWKVFFRHPLMRQKMSDGLSVAGKAIQGHEN